MVIDFSTKIGENQDFSTKIGVNQLHVAYTQNICLQLFLLFCYRIRWNNNNVICAIETCDAFRGAFRGAFRKSDCGRPWGKVPTWAKKFYAYLDNI